MNELNQLPSVDQLLQTQRAADLINLYGRPLTLGAIRKTLVGVREQLREGKSPIELSDLFIYVEKYLETQLQPTLITVINATGVVLHTNLGRAPLSQASSRAITQAASEYLTLEYDLQSGLRGSRSIHVENLIQLLTGAEAALVVNNNAAAVVLVLTALARRRRVVISRTQLVEIGGGFRVPEVMKQSGARLIEVGTTNRVHARDYIEALDENTALLMRAHHSNFKIIGFFSEPSIQELVSIAHERNIVVMDDIGSGALLDTARFGLAHEPMVQESLSAGVDIVCFSGDKLLGGPQAGIIVGRADLLKKIKKHPLARALRADKLCLAGLSATISHYLKDEAEREIPIWQMISKPIEEIRSTAERWQTELGTGSVIEGESTVGGGSLPGETMLTWLLALQVRQPNFFLAKLRLLNPPIVARVYQDRVVFDPRTVMPEQEEALLNGLKTVLNQVS